MGFPGRPVSGLLVPSLSRVFFSGGLEWPSCVKEYPSLLQSKKSASYQTLRMWVAGPHRRTPHLGPFVSSSEDSLHQPERASSSSVRPEGLRTPVGRPVGSSVLRQHHHSNVCPSPASFIMGSSNFKNTKNLFIHIALIPEGDNPRVNPNILKCLLHSPVAKGYRLVVIASRAMVCKTPTYYLILNSLAFARGCVILRSHILFPLLLILLISHHI